MVKIKKKKTAQSNGHKNQTNMNLLHVTEPKIVKRTEIIELEHANERQVKELKEEAHAF